MKALSLTQGYSASIDDVDYAAMTAIGNWCYADGYAVHYYKDELGQRKRHYLHRRVMERQLGHKIPPGLEVDHIDANRLNNQRSNLRLATKSENQAAKGIQKNSSSGYKGVTFARGKYEVRMRYYHKRIYLGRYESIDLAHAVYAYAHILLWGEFSSEQSVAKLSTSMQANIQAIVAKYKVG